MLTRLEYDQNENENSETEKFNMRASTDFHFEVDQT